jgi:hypothetical protein
MPTPWERGVQQTGRLTVFATDEFLKSPNYGINMFLRVLREFNRLTAGADVRMEQSTQPPDPTGPGANVQIDVTKDGTGKFFDEQGKPRTLQPPLDVSPGIVNGRTAKIGFPKLTRAFIFVPANPQAFAGRTVGPIVRMGNVLHELLHACGLDATDPNHGTTTVPPIGACDIYATGGKMLVDPRDPDKDRVELPDAKLSTDSAGNFFLTPRTVKLIQDIWLFGQF